MPVQSSINRPLIAAMLISGIVLSLIALYPQFRLWNAPHESGGNYAYNDIDEVAYSAYLRALIDGEPRRSDPYSGEYGKRGASSESLFSIQFATPYTIAIPARLFGVRAPAAMTIAGVIAAFLTAVFCCWLLFSITRSALFSCSGTLLVFCGGALFAWEGAIGEVIGTGFPYPYFPFIRRYIPAVPFPALMLYLLAAWKLLGTDNSGREKMVWLVVGFSAFSFLVFSYFYLWTAAFAWILLLLIGICVVRPEGWRTSLRNCATLAGLCLIPLGAYAWMLSYRSETMDQVQLLVYTRSPDLMRTPIFFGLVAVLVVLFVSKIKPSKLRSASFVYLLSLALVPIVLFNQQLITGMSLQPIHYEVFVGNYLVGLAVALALFSTFTSEDGSVGRLGEVMFSVIATVSVCWGVVEANITGSVLDEANAYRDRTLGVSEAIIKANQENNGPHTVFSTSSINADDLPTLVPNDVLWARHQHVFPGLTWEENKRRYYLFLYYQDLTPEWLDEQLRKGNFVASIALFGWARHTNRLSFDAKPLTIREVREEVGRYRTFYENFSRSDASKPNLGFLVTHPGNEERLVNLRKWYSLEPAGGVDELRVFRLSLK